jgi:acyl carrier protein
MQTIDETEFFERLATILDIEEVKPEDVLKEYEQWDSLAILSVLAMADSKYGITIKPEEIRAAVSAADLADLVDAKTRRQAHLKQG